MPLFDQFWCSVKKDDCPHNDNDDETKEVIAEDKSAMSLSYIGNAAYEVLRTKHAKYHHELWNVTHNSEVVGNVWHTPQDAFTVGAVNPSDQSGQSAELQEELPSQSIYEESKSQPSGRSEQSLQLSVCGSAAADPPPNHDDWFPKKLGELIAKTEDWCDILSLAPPTGLFLLYFQKALARIVQRRQKRGMSKRPTIIRIMFGNIIGIPVNCDAVIRELTSKLPEGADKYIKIWLGSWRKGVSWNHAKIVAIDGKYLWTGGHNLLDPHYLKDNPVNDLSIELSGPVARDAHLYANAQWGYILKKQSTAWGRFVDRNIPDGWDVPRRARVTVSEFPMKSGTAEFPPRYTHRRQLLRRELSLTESKPIPILSIGRYGVLVKDSRPSDDAIVAMFDAAKESIRIAVQDLGPVLLPGTKYALPGSVWPYPYLNALGRVIWLKGVDVEIVLSNPFSVPGHCPPADAQYGFGWDCVDIAAEIIKSIKTQYPEARDGDLRKRIQNNLRLCFIKRPMCGNCYSDGETIGLHSKHFIIDDTLTYIGSQNLYICDLAEWGVCIDHPQTVQSIKAQYWDPMWKISYTPSDCDVDLVMDGLKIDRRAPSRETLTAEQLRQCKEQVRASCNISRKSKFHSDQMSKQDFDALELIMENDADISEGED